MLVRTSFERQHIFRMFVTRCTRLLSSSKNVALLLNQKTTRIQGDPGIIRVLSTVSTIHPLMSNNVHSVFEQRTSTSVQQSMKPKMGTVERWLKKLRLLDMHKYRMIYLGYRVYEEVMRQVDYPFFFKYFNMSDTFSSWFLVTELHVWMIMIRYMADEKDGKIVRNNAVGAMWEDVKARVENLGKIKEKIKNEQIKLMSHQFNAAIIGYDEGIHSDDKVLAGALWNRFFQLECNNPEHIETLLIYVRKQICLFDSFPNEEILRKPVLKLIDIKTICKH